MFTLKYVKYLLVIALVNLLICVTGSAQTDTTEKVIISKSSAINIMTYNLKFASQTYQPLWSVRRQWQVDLINQYAPDIIGTQEGLKAQIDDLMVSLPLFTVVGEGREGGDDDEHMAIFFRRDKFRLREMGSFQLSETPNIIGSGPAVNPRMVTWVRLAFINKPKAGDAYPYPMDYRGHWHDTQEFYVFNTHLFTGGSGYQLAKRKSAKMILERINAKNRFGGWTKDRPVFLLGDFNARPGSEIYTTFVGNNTPEDQKLLRDNMLLKDSLVGGVGIDWILYKGNVKALSHEKIDYKVNGLSPSDHQAVITGFKFLNK